MPDSSIQPVSGIRVQNDGAQSCRYGYTSDGTPCLPNVIVLRQISFFILEAAEPSLNHDVICPPAFPVHALTDPIFLYKVNALLTCELASLIRIQDLRFRYFKGFFQGGDHHPCIKSIIDFPADNTAAVPVNHGRQIQESAPDGDIGNIDGPAWFGLSITALRRR